MIVWIMFSSCYFSSTAQRAFYAVDTHKKNTFGLLELCMGCMNVWIFLRTPTIQKIEGAIICVHPVVYCGMPPCTGRQWNRATLHSPDDPEMKASMSTAVAAKAHVRPVWPERAQWVSTECCRNVAPGKPVLDDKAAFVKCGEKDNCPLKRPRI